jgi:hypothetical protein
MFSLGIVSMTTGAMRMYFLISDTDAAAYGNPTWVAESTMVWGLIDIYIGIIIACLPMVKALVDRLWTKHTERTSASKPGPSADSYEKRELAQRARPNADASAQSGMPLVTETDTELGLSKSYPEEESSRGSVGGGVAREVEVMERP